jgi:hypothetical protein
VLRGKVTTTGDLSAAKTSSERRTVPAQLPAAASNFVGRDRAGDWAPCTGAGDHPKQRQEHGEIAFTPKYQIRPHRQFD